MGIPISAFRQKPMNCGIYFKIDVITMESSIKCITTWSFNDFQPHYLVQLTDNPDGTFTAVFDVYIIGAAEELDKAPEDYIINCLLIPSNIKHTRAECTFRRKLITKGRYIPADPPVFRLISRGVYTRYQDRRQY